MKRGKTDKELYQRLRLLPPQQLWDEEVEQFNRAEGPLRVQHVALVRAVGVVFAEAGTAIEKEKIRSWLRGLLHDPVEKIRRYAIAALPKLGAGPDDEAELLALFRSTQSDREKEAVVAALEKIGGTATLQAVNAAGDRPRVGTEQKLKAGLARRDHPSELQMQTVLSAIDGLRIHLRGRRGLEQIVRAEVEHVQRAQRTFRVLEVRSELVAIMPLAPFCLADLYQLRCFGTLAFVLGTARAPDQAKLLESLASVITSTRAQTILKTFTTGAIRYRLEFADKGHQRGAVRALSSRAYQLCSELLNDPREAPWLMSIHSTPAGEVVELSPRETLDPRFAYRQAEVPAASHPPLAACMARLAGPGENEIVWDPFCGSGVELIERALLGGVRCIHGTDHNRQAIEAARKNVAAANLKSVQAKFTCADFRDFAKIEGLGAGSATLVVTNPPIGKRVPVPNLRQLILDLTAAAAAVLRPGGRLVFVNPVRVEKPHPKLKLEFRQMVDLGGFACRLEKYVKAY
jgi:23S rRNA G2445 N2-methylase RlmL